MIERDDVSRSLLDVLERVVERGVVVAREGTWRRALDLLAARLIVVIEPELSGGGPGPRRPAPPAGG